MERFGSAVHQLTVLCCIYCLESEVVSQKTKKSCHNRRRARSRVTIDEEPEAVSQKTKKSCHNRWRARSRVTKDKEKKSNSRFEGLDSHTDRGVGCYFGPSFGSVPFPASSTNSSFPDSSRTPQGYLKTLITSDSGHFLWLTNSDGFFWSNLFLLHICRREYFLFPSFGPPIDRA